MNLSYDLAAGFYIEHVTLLITISKYMAYFLKSDRYSFCGHSTK